MENLMLIASDWQFKISTRNDKQIQVMAKGRFKLFGYSNHHLVNTYTHSQTIGHQTRPTGDDQLTT
jgi:hypothetical protein